MNKLKNIILELIPVFAIILLLIFFRGEIALTVFVLLAIVITFFMDYQKKEVYILIFGMIIGIIFELIGNLLLGQVWGEASFFKIPLWLPLTWGYGFVIIRRVGNVIVK